MYDYIKGIFVSEKNLPTGISITVETGGIGYLIKTTERTFNQMPAKKLMSKYMSHLSIKTSLWFYAVFAQRRKRFI